MSFSVEEMISCKEDIDALMRINTELMSELWILRDRVKVLEKILEEKKVIAPMCVDDYVPDGTFSEKLEAERDKFVRRIAGAPWGKEINLKSLIKNGQR